MDRAFGTHLIENFHQWIEIRCYQMPPSLRLFTHGVMGLWGRVKRVMDGETAPEKE